MHNETLLQHRRVAGFDNRQRIIAAVRLQIVTLILISSAHVLLLPSWATAVVNYSHIHGMTAIISDWSVAFGLHCLVLLILSYMRALPSNCFFD